jgi:hypothetical protein
MKIKELVDLIGACQIVRIVDDEYNEIIKCLSADVPTNVGEKFIKSIYTKNDAINIVALDKRRRKWYNGNESNAESPSGKGITL